MTNIVCPLVKPTNFVTRGNHLRLYKRHFHYDLRKYYFGNRIIFHWNSRPEYVINSNFTGIFENRLDLFWKSQHFYYNYRSHLTGSHSQL